MLLKTTYSKAQHRLRKMLIKKYFELIGKGFCYRCREPIIGLDFHIDHIESWQGAFDPIASFFNIDNISISHPLCNSLARSTISFSEEKDGTS